MRLFLFKILFRLTWWIAPNRPRVNKIFDLYLDYIKEEEDREECRKRQVYLDKHVRPRTETYEHLTCGKQRAQYEPFMPPKYQDRDQPRSHYSDYEEAKAYHEGRS
jgi:hypothetical protein